MGIAYWEIGSGPALVIVQNLAFNHAEMEWSVPIMRAWYLELAKYFRIIRIDLRGSGLSDEPPSDDFFTPAGLGQDITAVVTAMGLEKFNLMGISSMGPTAIQYAVDRPEQVLGLVLYDTGPVLSELPLHRYAQAFAATFEFDLTPNFEPLTSELTPEDRHAITALITAANQGREIARRSFTGWKEFDVSGLLADVRAPTLIIKAADSLVTDHEQTRRLVVGIPVAQMRVVPGVMAPFMADASPVVEALVDFLTSGDYRPETGDDDELRTIVFTDLVSSTELLNRLGDEHGRAEIRSVEAAITDLCAQHHGQLIKNLGDGSLVSFKSTGRALLFALDLQVRMDESPFGMRIGLTAGEPIQEDGDIHGAVVVQASRIADLGDAGETIASNSVRLLSIGKDFSFEPWGEIQLKGFEELSTLWRVTKTPRP
jgi:pimeloyl-ACP methyl ester carboxylesterase/class 3 adenylate cyclase